MDTKPEKRQGSRLSVVVVALVLLASGVAVMWFQPFGPTLSVVLGSIITIVFIGLLPVLLKGEAGVASEQELIRREYSDEESPDPYRRR